MTVEVTSGVPVFAGPNNIVTSITAPNQGVGFLVTIGDVAGLQAALDTKLEDVIGTIAPNTVDVTITGAELNFLAGVTSLIQTQLDGKVDLTGDTMTGSLLMGAGSPQVLIDFGTAALPGLAFNGDSDTGLWWVAGDTLGIAVGTLDAFHILPSGLLQSQVSTYETLVVADDDIPNKKYVDDEIALAIGGPFLPLAGGAMTGDIELDGVARLRFDADDDTFLEAFVDDVLNLWIGGAVEFTFDVSCLDVGTKTIKNVVDPTGAQDAATMNYVDTEIIALSLNGTGPYLRLSGADTMVGALDMGTNLINNVVDPVGAQDAATMNYVDTEIIALSLNGTGPYLRLSGADTMAGNLDMAGNNVRLDVDLDTFIESAADDLMQMWVGGVLVLGMDGSTIDAKVQRITDVVDPTGAQDAATMNYVDTEIIALSLNGTGPYLRLSGADTMVGALDMGTNQINAVVDPTLAQDAATKNYADTTFMPIGGGVPATGDLDMGGFKIVDLATPTAGTDGANKDYVDTTFLPLAGGTMSGAIDMGSSQINALAAPTIGTDAANKDYVDSEITALGLTGTGPYLELAGGTMTGDITMDTGAQVLADQGTSGAPGYGFDGRADTGMYDDGTNLRLALDGSDAMTLTPSGGSNEVDVHGRKVTGLNLAGPTTDDDAVNLGFLDGLKICRVLASASGIDLLSTGTTALGTVPAGKMWIITQIVVRATAYTPGGAPSNPDISVGTGGPDYDHIVADSATLDWGGTAGAADQAVYVAPKDGAETPNAGTTVTFQVDTAGGGTFSALTAEVYLIGFEC